MSTLDGLATTAIDDRPEPLRRRLLEAALIGLLALVLNLAGNGSRGLWDRDEPRYAGCTREMRASGDLIRPTFNAEPRFQKPVLIYWLMLAGTAIAGDNPFGARLVSAFAGVGSCLLVWGLGRRMFGRRAGRLAALMLATTPLALYNAKAATTDATLLFFLLACQYALWELSRPEPAKGWAGVFWVSLALATLTKGPVGPAILLLAGVGSWWWGGPTACWRRLRWSWGLPVYAVLTAPWYIAIAILSRGHFYRVAMGQEVVQRMVTGLETHGGFPGYYLATSVVAFYPWSALLPAGLLAAWVRRRTNPALGFLLGWIVGPLILLEAVRTKLVHYYLPCLPACLLLGVWLLDAVAVAGVNLRRWPLGRTSLGLLTGVGTAMTVALLAGALVVPGELRPPFLVMAVVLGPGTLYALERFQAGAMHRAALSLAGTWAVVLLVASGWLAPALDRYRLAPKVARGLADLAAREGANAVLFGFKPPSIVYEMGRPVAIHQGREQLIERLRSPRPVVTAMTPFEVEFFRRDPRLAIEVRDFVQGIDTENPTRHKGMNLVVIRPSPVFSIARAPEKSLVK